jgi:hypothetical protein
LRPAGDPGVVAGLVLLQCPAGGLLLVVVVTTMGTLPTLAYIAVIHGKSVTVKM